MFIVNLTYVKPLEEVEKILPEHIQYLEKYYESGNFICSGRKNPRKGGIILSNAKDLKEIEKIIREDPFYKAKIAEYGIIEFLPTKHTEGFEKFAIN